MKRLLFAFSMLLAFASHAWAQDQLNTPEVVDNGASVRIAATFSPALAAGDSFVLLVNGKQVLKGSLLRGSMADFSTNVIANSSPAKIALNISNEGRIRQAARTIQVTLPGPDQPPDTSPIVANSVRVRPVAQSIRMLFTREAPFVGQMKLSDDSFSLTLSSEGGLSKSSYLSVGGKFSDQLALTFDQGSDSQIRDDPKVFGRSARGG